MAGSRARAKLLDMPIADLLRGRRPLERADSSASRRRSWRPTSACPPSRPASGAAQGAPAHRSRGGVQAMRDALRRDRAAPLSVERPAPRAVRPAAGRVGGRRQRRRQATTIGKLAAAPQRRGPHDAAVRSRHLPRRRGRAAGSGPSAPARPSTGGAGRRRSVRRCSPTPCARPRGPGATSWCWSTPPAGCTPRATSWPSSRRWRASPASEMPGAPHETLLVLDATVGSNGLAQGREFAQAGG